jgi:cellulose synthase/poly-beta-1,6-N-acetylglucosamine synthase-like glycosyltransferase
LLAALLLALTAMIGLYVVAVYPVLLKYWRRAAPPVKKDREFRPTVSVLLTVYNGEDFIRKKLESLFALKYPAHLLDVVVVSDGSTDATDEIVAGVADRRVRLVKVPHGGKSAALNAGMIHASGEIVFFTDVRQTLDPDALSNLVANFADPSVGAVTGAPRFLHANRVGEQADMDLYWRYELWTRQRHSQIDSVLVTTGWIYALRRGLAEPIPPDTLADDAIIPLRVLLRGYRVIFDPEALAFDYADIQGGEFRRKLRTLAGLWQVCVRLPRLFTRANRMRFHFISNKVARLVLPWAILCFCAATFALPASRFRLVLLIAELAALALALLDGFLPRHSLLRRMSSPARSFLIVNTASLLSVMVFFVRPETLWRPTRIKGGAPQQLLNKQAERES